MGALKGGYKKIDAITPEQKTFLNQLLQQAQGGLSGQGALSQDPLYQQAAQGYKDFLPGGQGFNPIAQNAQQMFKQETIPSILNAYGTDNKGSSSLNQAFASGANNLNSNLAALQSQMQLQAAQGASQHAQNPYNLALQQGNLGLGTQAFGYQQRESILANILKAVGQGAGAFAGSYFGGGAGGLAGLAGGLAGGQGNGGSAVGSAGMGSRF